MQSAMVKPLPDRVAEGLALVAAAARGAQWQDVKRTGLTPTQEAILRLVVRRDPPGLRTQAISRELGLSQPTVSDSAASLSAKKLLRRVSDPEDARASLLRPTANGRKLITQAAARGSPVGGAVATLRLEEQAALLELVIKTIRALQLSGTIAPQRTCVSCRHFRAYTHAGTARPHHCAFVNAAFGSADLRLDCGDHDTAEPDVQAATWREFAGEALNHGTAPQP